MERRQQRRVLHLPLYGHLYGLGARVAVGCEPNPSGRRAGLLLAMPGKRVQFDDETLEALEALASRTGKSFQELTGAAFLKAALKQSVWQMAKSAASSLVPRCGTIELTRVIENQ